MEPIPSKVTPVCMFCNSPVAATGSFVLCKDHLYCPMRWQHLLELTQNQYNINPDYKKFVDDLRKKSAPKSKTTRPRKRRKTAESGISKEEAKETPTPAPAPPSPSSKSPPQDA